MLHPHWFFLLCFFLSFLLLLLPDLLQYNIKFLFGFSSFTARGGKSDSREWRLLSSTDCMGNGQNGYGFFALSLKAFSPLISVRLIFWGFNICITIAQAFMSRARDSQEPNFFLSKQGISSRVQRADSLWWWFSYSIENVKNEIN